MHLKGANNLMPVITGYIQESVDKGLEMESPQCEGMLSHRGKTGPFSPVQPFLQSLSLKDIAGSDIMKLEVSHHMN